MKYVRFLAVLLTLIPLSGVAWSRPVAGYYGGAIVIGIDPRSRVLTGYFEQYRLPDPRTHHYMFSCLFAIYGKPDKNGYKIITWYPGEPGRIGGRISFNATGLRLKLDDEPPGCMNVAPDDFAHGEYFEIDRAATFLAVRLVSAKRAYFYKLPDLKKRERDYAARGDAIRIVKSGKYWVLGESGHDHVLKGWIREADLAPLPPEGTIDGNSP